MKTQTRALQMITRFKNTGQQYVVYQDASGTIRSVEIGRFIGVYDGQCLPSNLADDLKGTQ